MPRNRHYTISNRVTLRSLHHPQLEHVLFWTEISTCRFSTPIGVWSCSQAYIPNCTRSRRFGKRLPSWMVCWAQFELAVAFRLWFGLALARNWLVGPGRSVCFDVVHLIPAQHLRCFPLLYNSPHGDCTATGHKEEEMEYLE